MACQKKFWGRPLQGRRDKVLLSTKGTVRMGEGPNNLGSSRSHLTDQLNGSLRRLGTDYVDIYHIHTYDAQTPLDETLDALTNFVHQGKVRYIACSNFSGWHLMKSMAISEKYGWQRYVAHQVYYSLIGREYEWELMPLGIEERVSALIWSPLGWGRLTGKIRRNQPLPEISRLHKTAVNGPPISDEYLYKVVDALDASCQGDRKDRRADCSKLAAAATDGRQRDLWRSERRAIERKSWSCRLEADTRAGCYAGRGQRGDADLSLLAAAHFRTRTGFDLEHFLR